jgi:clorobiocin biosynthesis protein CloN6
MLPPLKADLLLLHAPAFFEFRGRRDIYFPFLGTSGDVPITPLYEYFPVGFKTLQRHLGDRGHDVRILNLASLFVRYPHLSADAVLGAIEAPVVGIDLHWMIHVQRITPTSSFGIRSSTWSCPATTPTSRWPRSSID